jgi:PhzF family phenazine biosynthesis protein
MRVPIYIVDSFTNRLFAGNPAAVCPLQDWPDDALLQSIAAENNLSETAFYVRAGERYTLRWFTPTVEVDLCGHATLASAHIILRQDGAVKDAVVFDTRSGPLTVMKEGERLAMDFPIREVVEVEHDEAIDQALGVSALEVYRSKPNLLVILGSEDEVRQLQPDLSSVERLDCNGVIVSAAGRDVDFVSRYFGPRVGLPEDPVTGSAHCTLVPYWGRRLRKSTLHAHQLSARGGELFCEMLGERVKIAGEAVTYAEGVIKLYDIH